MLCFCNSIEIKNFCCCNLIWCNFISAKLIATKFCTCHDSTVVVACAKFCSNHSMRTLMSVEQKVQNFKIWWENHWWNVRQIIKHSATSVYSIVWGPRGILPIRPPDCTRLSICAGSGIILVDVYSRQNVWSSNDFIIYWYVIFSLEF